MVEPQSSKLTTRVRFPSSPPFKAPVRRGLRGLTDQRSTADAHTQARCSAPSGPFHLIATARGVHATATPSTWIGAAGYRTHAVTGSGWGVRVNGYTSSCSSSSVRLNGAPDRMTFSTTRESMRRSTASAYLLFVPTGAVPSHLASGSAPRTLQTASDRASVTGVAAGGPRQLASCTAST